MIEIPKIVRARLQAKDGGSHPDPDLLTAFVERSLARKERSQILAHLSACADCREVVMLAAPEFEAAGLAVRHSPRTSWLSWPVLRWSAAIACVVVVGTAVSLHYQEIKRAPAQSTLQSSDRPTSYDSKAAATSANELAAKPAMVSVLPAKKAAIPENKLKQSPEELDHFASNAPTRDDAASRMAAAPAPMAQAAMSKSRQAAGAAPETVEVAGASPLVATGTIPGKAKDADQEPATSTAGANLAADAARPFSRISPVLRTMNAAPRWTLASDGTLQRSLDSGRSWETISVGNAGTFRALAANGLDIWVGGTAGSLYHSADAGQHWTRIQPAANGSTLTADIIGVEFPDPQHGKITTAQSETWTTEDSGATWQKQ